MSTAGNTTSGSDFATTGSYDSLLTVIVLNSGIALGIFLIFGILRSCKKNYYFFAPNYYDQEGTSDTLPHPGRGLFSWIRPTVKFSEDELFTMRGMDAVIYLKFLKYLVILFLLLSPLGLGILLPLDATSDAGATGVPSLSLTNVTDDSNVLWLHGIYAIFCTFIAFVILYQFYDKYTQLRISWMKLDVPHNYSVMYKGIPKDSLKHKTPMEFFSQYFPGEVVDAQVGVHAGHLRKLVKKWEKANEKLHFARDALSEHGKHVTVRKTPIFGEKVDAIDYYQQELSKIGAQIELQRRELIDNSENSQVGFVTFNTIGLAAQNAQLLMDRKATKLVASPAPQPRDIYWRELELPNFWRAISRPVSWIMCSVLILFWGALTVFVQAIANLDKLSTIKGFRWLGNVRDWNPSLYGLISGFLPALAVIILFAFLPDVLTAIVKFKGVYTRSQVKRNVLKYYFIFLVVNVFILSILSGGTIGVLNQLLDSTGSDLLILLGSALPAQSSFFISYVLTYALTKYPLNLLRVGAFISSRMKRITSRSCEEIKKAERPKSFEYELLCGIQLIIFVIGFAYAPIAPFILPFVILFYAITWLFGKYLLIYVYNPKYDSGGLYWPDMFNRLVFGMFLSQITLIGVFIFKSHPAVAIVAPLPFATIAYGIVVKQLFSRPSTYLSMNEYPMANNGEVFMEVYKDPVLKLDTHACCQMHRRKSEVLMEEGKRRPVIGYGSI